LLKDNPGQVFLIACKVIDAGKKMNPGWENEIVFAGDIV
jgi:hypothetical protein